MPRAPKQNQMHLMSHLGLKCLQLLVRLPLPLLHLCGRCLGSLGFFLFAYRRQVARINLKLCFPELSAREANTIAHDSFRACMVGALWGFKVLNAPAASYGKMLAANSEPPPQFIRRIIWQGDRKLEQVLGQRQRVLLLGGHFASMDIAGWAVCRRFAPVISTYKTLRNPVFDQVMYNRLKYMQALIDIRDTFLIKRSFKKGHLMWMTIDQDLGKRYSVFAPFFATHAATHTAGWRWARMMDAEAFLLHATMLPGYVLQIFFHHLIDFRDLQVKEAIAYQNEMLMRALDIAPAQYLWMHRRFKSQPRGEPYPYPRP